MLLTHTCPRCDVFTLQLLLCRTKLALVHAHHAVDGLQTARLRVVWDIEEFWRPSVHHPLKVQG
jgi:hypothetical protein